MPNSKSPLFENLSIQKGSKIRDQAEGKRRGALRSAEEEGGGGGGTGIRTRTPAQIRSGWAERSGGAFQRAASGILPSSSASELTSSARAHALEQHGLLGSAKTSQTRQLSSIFDFDVTSAARARRANLLCLFQKKKPRCGPGQADPARNREQASVSPNSLEAATRIAFRSHPPHDTVKPELLLSLPLCTDSLRAPSQNSESKTFTLPTAIANGAEQTFREACDSAVLQYRGLAFRRCSAWKALLRVESPSNTGARTKKKKKKKSQVPNVASDRSSRRQLRHSFFLCLGFLATYPVKTRTLESHAKSTKSLPSVVHLQYTL